MQCFSTHNPQGKQFGLLDAIQMGLAPDGGLFMPVEIPKVTSQWLKDIQFKTFPAIAYELSVLYFPEVDKQVLRSLCEDAFNFPAPLVPISRPVSILELFHGPTLAFKDFGARFMARMLGYLNSREKLPLHILVATSGDTGGAVSDGFHGVEGIDVTVLFPKGKVSPLQQKQITTLGDNIHAIAIEGTFDDCQAIVKQALVDPELIGYRLSSANSINLARLIPQSFYYFEALRQMSPGARPVFVVPSGNFGNLVAGIMAQRMGLPASHFVAATNINDIVPSYLKDGLFRPKPSRETLSNAMDVGNPSNFRRLESLYGSTWNTIKSHVSGYAYTDEETLDGIKQVFQKYNYLLDPHGAVGYLAADQYNREHQEDQPLIVLETAHPAKFLAAYERLGIPVEIPQRLARQAEKKDLSITLPNDYSEFIDWFRSAHHQ
ncbi:MAG: threonine synthase [Saprospiraceae bacterium]|nr:threonine synthase [Saprospiraceae bacterium]